MSAEPGGGQSGSAHAGRTLGTVAGDPEHPRRGLGPAAVRATRRVLARAFTGVRATDEEVRAALAGDDLVGQADVTMDRAFTLAAPPQDVWPWLQQLGKGRAGWYLPRPVERLVPRKRRALRSLDPRWQRLAVADVVPDYGGEHASFTVEEVHAPDRLVFSSRRGRVHLSWALVLTSPGARSTRVHLRLRLGPVRRPWLAETVGELVDALTVAGMAAGLAERVEAGRPGSRHGPGDGPTPPG